MNSFKPFRFLFSIFLLILFFYSTSIGINSFIRYNVFNQEYKRKMSELVKYKHKQQVIVNQINDLNSPLAWESLARNNLNMIKVNEVQYRFYYQEVL